VIVGIDHGGPRRIDELSPFRCRMSKGQLNRLLAWMNKTLIPRIHADFPVRRDVGGAAIGGSSMGGLAALYAHYQRPELFGAALCMSPSLWLARGKIFRWLEKQSRPWTSRIYVDAGAHEGRMLKDADKLVAHLRARGYGDNDLRWRPDPPRPPSRGRLAPPRPLRARVPVRRRRRPRTGRLSRGPAQQRH
jgi:enterochelin esterase-like enzyme